MKEKWRSGELLHTLHLVYISNSCLGSTTTCLRIIEPLWNHGEQETGVMMIWELDRAQMSEMMTALKTAIKTALLRKGQMARRQAAAPG